MASYTVYITNNTGVDLALNNYDHSVGWKTPPPDAIANGAKGCFCNAGPNSAGGWAEYFAKLKDKTVNLKWHWRIPAVGKNHCDVDADPKDYLLVTSDGGNCSGYNPTQYFLVQPVATGEGATSFSSEGDKTPTDDGPEGECGS